MTGPEYWRPRAVLLEGEMQHRETGRRKETPERINLITPEGPLKEEKLKRRTDREKGSPAISSCRPGHETRRLLDKTSRDRLAKVSM